MGKARYRSHCQRVSKTTSVEISVKLIFYPLLIGEGILFTKWAALLALGVYVVELKILSNYLKALSHFPPPRCLGHVVCIIISLIIRSSPNYIDNHSPNHPSCPGQWASWSRGNTICMNYICIFCICICICIIVLITIHPIITHVLGDEHHEAREFVFTLFHP